MHSKSEITDSQAEDDVSHQPALIETVTGTLSTSDLRGIIARTFVDITRWITARFGFGTAMSLAV